MEASVPRGVEVHIGTMEQSIKTLRSKALQSKRILLLFASSDDALRAHQQGVDFSELNLGNMHAGQGKVKLSCTISLDPGDVENLQILERDGVEITSRCVPGDAKRGWRKLLRGQGESDGG